MAAFDEDDVESPVDEIPNDSDVFSYSMLTAEKQRKKYGYFTNDAAMSYCLVALVLCIQGVLLWCVYNKVVVNNAHWVRGIMSTGEDWALFSPSGQGCNTGSSLCTIENGTYSCAPPSVQLTGRWNELDVNGDGIWTREEVLAERERLKCKYVVDPVEIFDVFIFLLQERKHLIWLHPDVAAGKAIHKPYFTYAMGDIALCGYRNQDMCPNLLKRGVFHTALKYDTAPRVGNTVESALDYCREMLEPMGVCERTLPSTYATWKIESVVQCQKPKYSKFVYENPGNGVRKSLLAVDYKARQRYEVAKTPLFMLYKGMICGVWMLLIVSQLRAVWRVLSWVIHFPALSPEEEKATKKRGRSRRSDDDEDKVEGISQPHRLFMAFVTVLRILMLCILMYVGISFLSRQTDYIGLLLDGVALIFIIEVQEVIYEKVIRAEVRESYEGSQPVQTQKIGLPYLNRRTDVADILWLTLIIVGSFLFITHYTATIVTPLHDSLECACLSEGEHCYEASRFSNSFWDKYWRYDVPGVFQDLKSLKSGQWQYDQNDGTSFWQNTRSHHAGTPKRWNSGFVHLSSQHVP